MIYIRLFKYVLVILVFAQTNIFAQQDDSATYLNRTDSLGLKQGVWQEMLEDTMYSVMVLNYDNNLKNGKYTVYFSDGNKAIEGFWKNDSLHGIIINYYRSGVAKYIINYNMGSMEGWFYAYYRNGNIKEIKYYKNNKPIGTYYSFYKNGNIELKILPEDKNGFKKKILYFPNGNIKGTGYLLNEQNHGEFISYDLNGNVIHIEHFVHGDKVN